MLDRIRILTVWKRGGAKRNPVQKRPFNIRRNNAMIAARYSFSLKEDMPRIRKKRDIPIKIIPLMNINMSAMEFLCKNQLVIQVV